ncbi:MAG: hypothetical protein ACLQU4_19645 [Limisphaerales bacterium]
MLDFEPLPPHDAQQQPMIEHHQTKSNKGGRIRNLGRTGGCSILDAQTH